MESSDFGILYTTSTDFNKLLNRFIEVFRFHILVTHF